MSHSGKDSDSVINRRRFLTATSGIAGMTALAGCGSDGTDTEGGSDGNDDDGPAEDSGTGDGGKEMGEKLPTYTFYNNPANYNAARHDMINLIGTQFNEIGFDVNVEVLEWGTLFQRVTEEFDYGFAAWGAGLGIYPGTLMPYLFHSSNTDSSNLTGYTNEDLDPLLNEQLEAVDVDERVDILHEIQSVINEDVPMHPIVQMPNLVAFNNEQVGGWTDHLVGYYHMEPQTNIEVTADHNELRGTWAETLGTLNVLGYNNETKLFHQFEMLYDKLVRNNQNLEPDPELSLATEWERPDAETVRYRIREGHSWHDGEEVTPEDIVFTIQYLKENEIPIYSTQYQMVDSVERDGQWVQVNFADPAGPVHQTFSNQFPVIPEHIWSEREDPGNISVTEPVGSGPLKFDYWDRGSELSLVKNEDHWNTVNYDRRIWRIIPESSTVWSLLLDGQLNYLPYTRLGRQLHENQSKDQISVKKTSSDGWWHLSQNTRREGLDDPAVRRAAVEAVPKSAINDQLLYGFAKPGWNLIGESFGQYSNPDVPHYQADNDIETAQQILEDAGYVFDDDGMVHFSGE